MSWSDAARLALGGAFLAAFLTAQPAAAADGARLDLLAREGASWIGSGPPVTATAVPIPIIGLLIASVLAAFAGGFVGVRRFTPRPARARVPRGRGEVIARLERVLADVETVTSQMQGPVRQHASADAEAPARSNETGRVAFRRAPASETVASTPSVGGVRREARLQEARQLLAEGNDLAAVAARTGLRIAELDLISVSARQDRARGRA